MTTAVTAIVGGPRAARARCEQALGALSVPTASDAGAAPDGLLWFLSSAGVPDADTLPRLLSARTEEEATLVSGVAVDGDGAVVSWLSPTARSCDTAEMYAMLARRRMPLIGAGTDCLLVPREHALRALAGKQGRFGRLAGQAAVSELLEQHRGVIAADAHVTVDLSTAPKLGMRDVPRGLRAVRAGVVTSRDLLNQVAPHLR